MLKTHPTPELHRSDRIGWLRAAVLGANDGIISVSSLVVGVAAAHSTPGNILLTGVAGLFAGAFSMASGEFVSVSSQSDTERADLAREKSELSADVEYEREELAQIYVGRGLTPELARQVSEQLMAHDALGSHARDELGIFEGQRAQPLQAAMASAAAFSVGALMPLAVVLVSPASLVLWSVFTAAILFLVALGVLAAWIGGADRLKAALRVGFWGALAMGLTAGIGALFGTVV